MVDHLLRRPKEQVMAPVARLVGHRIAPTTLTLISFSFGLAAVASIWQGLYGLGCGLWLLNRIVDGLDGTVARKTSTQSDWGGYLDILLDTVIYALVPFSLVLADSRPEHWIALAVLLSSFYINAVSWAYLAAVLEKRNAGAKAQGELTSITMPTGLIEGTETVIFFTAFILLAQWLVWLYWAMALLVVVTLVQRLVWAARTLGAL